MQFKTLLPALAAGALAQTFSTVTDSNGIQFYEADFSTTVATGNAKLGLALPPADATDLADEYIGHLAVPRPASGTWMGLSHMPSMTGSLLLVTWVNENEVMTNLRYASGYTAPEQYTGNASVIPISSSVNDTYYEITFRCKGCWKWSQDGVPGSAVPATTASAAQIIAWAQATEAPANPAQTDSSIVQHAADNIFGIPVASARNTAYTNWMTKTQSGYATPAATAAPSATGLAGTNSTGTGAAGATGTGAAAAATSTGAACPATNTLGNTTYDYIIVGSGAGGIPLAAKLADSGKSVLLIERGPASSGRWGGTMKPDWLVGTNLTRFDVPGLDNEIWEDSDGIACTDYSVMAGCVLGGGTAVNAGLWWRANPADFDVNFPQGWKSNDMQPAIARVFDKIPFTDHPSMDGIIYKPQGYNIVAGALASAGWKNVTADLAPGEKNMTFSHPNHMFSHGERGGPMATYLVDAYALPNFKLMVNTTVNRVIRSGSQASGVEVEAFLPGGQCGQIKVKTGGKVILSAGAFGTPKILMRSGIGPQDQLETVQKAEGTKMVSSSDWLNLPVGYNLDDHTDTDVVITHPDVQFYDFYGAYDNPIPSDKNKYLDSRTGILAQSAPNLAAVFWQEITGADGIVRQMQYTARVESARGIKNNQSMTISQYLGRGKVSKGRTTITAGLNMVVSDLPYINNDGDLAAIKTGLQSLIDSLATDKRIKVVAPAANTSIDDYLASYPITTGARSANHWMGSCKMGLDSGLKNNGTAVVDTDTKVYGMDNLFVVDASIFPGMVSTNPSALIVAVAEHAAEKIMGLKSNSTSVLPASGTGYATGIASATDVIPTASATLSSVFAPSAVATTAPFGNGTQPAFPTGTASSAPAASTGGAAQIYQRCGGIGYSGPTACEASATCKQWNPYYFQCVPAGSRR